ncbi:MAG TPA: signal peptidase I [Solirubrobacteraceae bacterium]
MRWVSTTATVLAGALLVGCAGKSVTVTVTTQSIARSPTRPPVKRPTRLPVNEYRVPSGSMEPTLGIGSHVTLQPGSPKVGEIAVFYPPEGAEEQVCGPQRHTVVLGAAACSVPIPTESDVNFIKRIVAGPGDEIYVKEGHVYRNGLREQDSYIKECGPVPECNFLTPIKISAGHWFMMGDNRGESDDSRFYGPIPTSWIVGIVRGATPQGSSE